MLHADLRRDAICLLNDMAVAPNGNAYVGSTGRNFFTGDTLKRLANVILVWPDGSSEVVAEAVAGPNGAVITPDGLTYILAESNQNRLLAFDIGGDGRLSNRRVWAELDPLHPDGIALDAVAHNCLALFTSGVADDSRPGVGFHQHVAAKTCHHKPGVRPLDLARSRARRFAQASRASAFDAQKKSLTDRPFTSCVLKRTVHLL